MKYLPSFTRYAALHYYKRAIYVFVAGVLMIVPFLLMQFEERTKSKIAGFFAVATFLAVLGMIFHTVPEVVGRMERGKGLLLREAVSQTCCFYVTLIPLIPVLGPILSRAFEIEKEKNPFENKED
jgi:hypothetical protein